MSALACAIVDYGVGNLHSARKALQRVADGRSVDLCSDAETLLRAERLVLPGVGAIGSAMQSLEEAGLREAVLEFIGGGRPALAICIGMQMLMRCSEEDGGVDGLAVIDGEVRRFAEQGEGCKLPHMGWGRLRDTAGSTLWRGLEDEAWFYFVHSYFAQPADSSDIAAFADYGRAAFAAAVRRDNVLGVQFHPEKSAACGLRLLGNFLDWKP